MARTKSVAPEALAALGAEALAQVLIAHADTDPVLRKKLVMLLASTEGSGKLAAEIDKRIKTIGRSRSFVDWEKRKLLVQELDHLRATIATRLAAQDRERAIELLWDFLGIADTVLNRMGDGIGAVEEIFGAAMEDLGRLSATPPPRNPKALARRVLAYCERGVWLHRRAHPPHGRGAGCGRADGNPARHGGCAARGPSLRPIP